MVEIKKSNVVVIGGGTGSSIILSGLKKYDNCNLFAIVPMGDSGGSSGKLREEFGILSAGEIRQRAISLASEENGIKELANLMNYRFEKGKGLIGHNFGNILIAGLTELHGSQEKAIEVLSTIVNAKGKIIPSTWDRFELVAEYENGKKIVSEHFIDESNEEARITRLYTQPVAKANPEAIGAIKNADVLIFGPGDLYTSIMHNLVVDGIPKAIRESDAKKILICNLMTSVGETTGMNLQDLLNELERYIGAKVIDTIVINSKELPPQILEKYENNGQFPVEIVLNGETKNRIKILERDLLAEEFYIKSNADILHRSILRHDPDKIGAALIDLIQGE